MANYIDRITLSGATYLLHDKELRDQLESGVVYKGTITEDTTLPTTDNAGFLYKIGAEGWFNRQTGQYGHPEMPTIQWTKVWIGDAVIGRPADATRPPYYDILPSADNPHTHGIPALTGSTDEAGNHSHNVVAKGTISEVGNHTHTFHGTIGTTDEAGLHIHSVTVPAQTITAAAATTGAPSGATGSFTGTAVSHSHTFEGVEISHNHVFNGTAASHSHTFTGTSTHTSQAANHTHNVSGSIPGWSITASTYTASDANAFVLNITEESKTLSGVTADLAGAHSHTVTATGTISTVTITPAGTIGYSTFTPAGSISVVTLTPAGTVSVTLPSFGAFAAGMQVSITTHTYSTTQAGAHTHNFTPDGVLESNGGHSHTFTGTTAVTSLNGEHDHSVTTVASETDQAS